MRLLSNLFFIVIMFYSPSIILLTGTWFVLRNKPISHISEISDQDMKTLKTIESIAQTVGVITKIVIAVMLVSITRRWVLGGTRRLLYG